MTKKDKDEWQKRKGFSKKGIGLEPWSGLNVEHQNTLRHEFVKWALTAALYQLDREWDSEVRFPNGREADIVDIGPTDGKCTVYEVETDVTPKRKKEKLNHFYDDFEHLVRDVIVIEPSDVPPDFEEAVEYLLEYEVI